MLLVWLPLLPLLPLLLLLLLLLLLVLDCASWRTGLLRQLRRQATAPLAAGCGGRRRRQLLVVVGRQPLGAAQRARQAAPLGVPRQVLPAAALDAIEAIQRMEGVALRRAGAGAAGAMPGHRQVRAGGAAAGRASSPLAGQLHQARGCRPEQRRAAAAAATAEIQGAVNPCTHPHTVCCHLLAPAQRLAVIRLHCLGKAVLRAHTEALQERGNGGLG